MFLRRTSFVVTLVFVAVGMCAAAPSPAAKSTPDFSKEAAILESYKMAYTFQNDGTYTQDITARIKVTCPSFCTTRSERVYITAPVCVTGLGVASGLKAAGTGSL